MHFYAILTFSFLINIKNLNNLSIFGFIIQTISEKLTSKINVSLATALKILHIRLKNKVELISTLF